MPLQHPSPTTCASALWPLAMRYGASASTAPSPGACLGRRLPPVPKSRRGAARPLPPQPLPRRGRHRPSEQGLLPIRAPHPRRPPQRWPAWRLPPAVARQPGPCPKPCAVVRPAPATVPGLAPLPAAAPATPAPGCSSWPAATSATSTRRRPPRTTRRRPPTRASSPGRRRPPTSEALRLPPPPPRALRPLLGARPARSRATAGGIRAVPGDLRAPALPQTLAPQLPAP
mmetsp:Transcript_123147/g.394390  ORF Transcript_123147/g.394390 Transcript_123147/m.394390 type:complete len:229 (+) Transcript_123147:1363-2049(+)